MSTSRATVWSLTINNPADSDEECIAIARQKGWKVEGQIEKASTGTLHYQLMLRTPQVRASAVKSVFPRAHIEIAKNIKALEQYVKKEETRVGQLPVGQEKYPSLSKFWELIYIKLCDRFEQPVDEMDWSSFSDRRKLDLLDEATCLLIEDGFHVESIAINPATRSAFVKFCRSLMIRVYADRQTDRQLELSAAPQELSLPTINADATVEEESNVAPSSP